MFETKYMKKILFFLLPSLLFISCKEEDASVEEFANWQSVSETAFKAKYSQAIANGSDNIDTLRCFSLTKKPSPQPEDYIIVEKIGKIDEIMKRPGVKPGIPLFTDSVSVSYRGRLQPSVSFPSGYVFDQSFTLDKYDPQTAKPTKFAINTLTVGFSTALQNMEVGDYWRVYIPHQLGYGSASQSSIPAYSMLTFDIILEKYWQKK